MVTAVEEFGLAAVEAQASGRPVISVGAGGALETVVEGETGVFWQGGPDELAAAVTSFDADAIDPQACVRNAERFSLERFRERMPREVEPRSPASATTSARCPAARARSRRGLARPLR